MDIGLDKGGVGVVQRAGVNTIVADNRHACGLYGKVDAAGFGFVGVGELNREDARLARDRDLFGFGVAKGRRGRGVERKSEDVPS